MLDVNSAELRREERKAFLHEHFEKKGVALENLAEGTRAHLEAYARYALLHRTQPSADLRSAIVELASAVEAQTKAALSQVPGLEAVAVAGTLGDLARAIVAGIQGGGLRTRDSLTAKSLKPGFIERDLPGLLKRLGGFRGDKAHGHPKVRPVNEQDHIAAIEVARQALRKLDGRGA